MVWVLSAKNTFWGISLPVSHPKNSYSTRSRCSSVMAASLSGSSETSAPSTPACASASAASLTTASKKPSSSAEAAVGNAGGRPPQPSREVTAPWRGTGAALREACSVCSSSPNSWAGSFPARCPLLSGLNLGLGSSRVKGTSSCRAQPCLDGSASERVLGVLLFHFSPPPTPWKGRLGVYRDAAAGGHSPPAGRSCLCWPTLTHPPSSVSGFPGEQETGSGTQVPGPAPHRPPWTLQQWQPTQERAGPGPRQAANLAPGSLHRRQPRPDSAHGHQWCLGAAGPARSPSLRHRVQGAPAA